MSNFHNLQRARCLLSREATFSNGVPRGVHRLADAFVCTYLALMIDPFVAVTVHMLEEWTLSLKINLLGLHLTRPVWRHFQTGILLSFGLHKQPTPGSVANTSLALIIM